MSLQGYPHRTGRRVRWAWLCALGLMLAIAWPTAAQIAPTLPSTSNPPSQVKRFGNVEVAPVRLPLLQTPLVEVTAPTVYDRSDPAQQQASVEQRAAQVSANLNRGLDRFRDAGRIQVVVSQLNGEPILLLSDGQSQPIRLVTVTSLDAEYNGLSQAELAEQWRSQIQAAIERSRQVLSPRQWFVTLREVAQILLIAAIATLIFWGIQRELNYRAAQLEAQQRAAAAAAIESEAPPEPAESEPVSRLLLQRSRLLNRLRHSGSLEGQLSWNRGLRWLLFWLLIAIWYWASFRIITVTPILDQFRDEWLNVPIRLMGLWFASGIAIRIAHLLIERSAKAWDRTNLLAVEGDQRRRDLRITTIVRASKGLATVLIVFAVLLAVLNTLGLPASSVLAGSAILGLAISFGSQSLVKDLVNGCLILVEDQFAVGDVINLNGQGGLVETLNLRVTQIRDAEGGLITIPNSTISQVRNLSRTWSRVDFNLEVGWENNVDQVLACLRRVTEQLYAEPDWRELICEPPEVLGVDAIAHQGLMIKVWIKTQPLMQWKVGRELRRRVHQALQAEGISIGRPQQVVYWPDLEGQPQLEEAIARGQR
ncbi:mechanosensitive ion channel family protein [Synechococcus elongatus IITB7]|uniref:mechanosensitive ion channel family protein n=1 Tax=Synechococcus elongatus TaxID=32046 RepID=UPI0030CB0CD2